MLAATFRTSVALALAVSLNAQKIETFDFEAKTLGGQTITAKQFAGNVLIVDLWGTWCPPCVKAVPVLERLYRKYKQFGLEVVGFNYEGADEADPESATRKFAAKRGVTYHLALGTPAIKQQVPGMRAFPTMLFFDKGLAHSHTDVGFEPADEKRIEAWVRQALGLPALEEGGAEAAAGTEEPAEGPVEEGAPEQPEPLPTGVIFKPGDGDTGFDFKVEDVDGKTLEFAKMRGKVVVLALTATWDGEAARTAELLNRLHDEFAAGDTVVLAAFLERGQRAVQVKAVRDFRKTHDLHYQVFPAGLGFQEKIHLFTGMPLFLMFDKEGRLVLRESGISDNTLQNLRDAVQQHGGVPERDRKEKR